MTPVVGEGRLLQDVPHLGRVLDKHTHQFLFPEFFVTGADIQGHASWLYYSRCYANTDLGRAVIRDGDKPAIMVRTPGYACDFGSVTTQSAMRLCHHQGALWRILCAFL